MKKKLKLTLNSIIEKHIYENWASIYENVYMTKLEPYVKKVLKMNAKQVANKIISEVRKEVNKVLDKDNKI